MSVRERYRKIHEFRAVNIRRMWRFCGRHVGHRGAVIAFLVLLDVVYGYSLSTAPGPLANVNLVVSLRAWSFIWVSVGVLLLTGISARRDKFHFGLAVTVKVAWAATLFRSWITGAYGRGWVTAVIWGGFAVLVFIISSWPEGFISKHPLENKKCDGEE